MRYLRSLFRRKTIEDAPPSKNHSLQKSESAQRGQTGARMNITQRRIWIVILGILLLGALSSPIFYAHLKETRLKHLYFEAAGVPPYFSNTQGSIRAVHQIGYIGGDESRRFLMSIASGDSYFPNTSVRVAAIEELTRMEQADTSEMLASLVTIDNPLDLRKTSAEALQSVRCSDKCLAELLNYLKMIDDGQVNSEDRSARLFEGTLNAEVKKGIGAEQRDVYELLYRCLLLNSEATNDILEKTYGLGSANPQPFSIHFAVESKDHDACTLLIRSEHLLSANSSDVKMVRSEVDNALKALACEEYK